MPNGWSEAEVAIVGTGIAGVAAMITQLVDIAGNAKDDAPPVKVMVIDTRGPKPKSSATYPCGGLPARSLHPFPTEKPPWGFPTFGEYVDAFSLKNPGLKDALPAPTYAAIKEYMEQLLELAVAAAGATVWLDTTSTGIVAIQERTPGGPALIELADGTRLQVSKVVRGTPPKHMGGTVPSDASAGVAPRGEVPRRDQVPLTLDLLRSAADLALTDTGIFHDAGAKTHFTLLIGTRRVAVIALDGPEAAVSRRAQPMLQGLGRIGATELWVVTPESVGEPVESQLEGQPVRVLSLPQFLSLIEKLADVGPASEQ